MDQDKELKAMGDIVAALSGLDTDAQSRVINYVLGRLGIRTTSGMIKQVGLPVTPLQGATDPLPPSGGTTDIWTLRQQKNPRSAIQMAVLVGYYLKEIAPSEERKEIFEPADIQKYFTQAKFELPAGKKGAADTLNNAKKSGYLESIGSGVYKLNAVGYNLAAYRLNENGPTNEKRKASKTKKANSRKPAKKRK